MGVRVPILLGLLILSPALHAEQTAAEAIDLENAKLHFRVGSEFYASGHYAEALREFRAALRARPLPALHFNIARCYDRLERYAEAVEAYEAYLKAGPAEADVTEVKGRIAELRNRLTEEPSKILDPQIPIASSSPPPH